MSYAAGAVSVRGLLSVSADPIAGRTASLEGWEISPVDHMPGLLRQGKGKSMKKKIQTLKFIQQIGKMIFLKLETMLSLLQQTIGSYF